MSTYAIGDIQGCFDEFESLLERIGFDEEKDRLWLAGDLVNRGPKSLDVLHWARDHDHCISFVLGNHDLHLVGAALGIRPRRERDTMNEVLDAPDRDLLVDWLIHQPFFHLRDDWIMVHAGLHPSWTVERAAELAHEAEDALRADPSAFLEASYLKPAPQWRDDLEPPERWGALFQTLCRSRITRADGTMDLDFSATLDLIPDGWAPWFEHPHNRGKETTVLFGHWSALGFYETDGAICLDSGCVWGHSLTAYRLEDGAVFQEPSRQRS